MHISGTTALVTGANRGLGRALVDALLSRGAGRVYAAARDVASIERRDEDRVVALPLDLTSEGGGRPPHRDRLGRGSTRGAAAVYVRVVRFTDVTPERVEELVARIEQEDGPPPGVPVKGLQMLFDADQGTAVVLQHFDS